MEDVNPNKYNVVCEWSHSCHDEHWTMRFGDNMEEREQLICVACVIEMVEENSTSIVRKKYLLSCFRDVLVRYPGMVVELLSTDGRACIHFIITLMVLAALMEEFKSDEVVCCMLDQCQKQLSEKNSMRKSLPVFMLIGKLLLIIPFLAEKLIHKYSMLLKHMEMALAYPDESVRASVCYIFCAMYSYPPIVEKLSLYFNDRLCKLIISAMEAAQTKELQINSLGLLKHLLQFRHFVTVMMSSNAAEDELIPQETVLQGGNSLLLLLKKLLLNRDEMLQIISVQCMTSILVHSPVQYAPELVYADIPEFLFERLSSSDEILVWSIYSCLLLLTEEKLFFSKCHTIYGIESLVRSLKETMRMNNTEVQKQGLLLFGEILRRQPSGLKLFMNFAIWSEAVVVLQEAVTSSNFEVVTEAANAVSAFLRKDHLAVPIQYQELQSLIKALLMHCTDLSVPFKGDIIRGKEKHYEKTPNAAVMEVFFSVLSVQYNVLPSAAKLFSSKLASSSFIRFTMELKVKFCTGGRNPRLNQACSDFLCDMCKILFTATEDILNCQHGFFQKVLYSKPSVAFYAHPSIEDIHLHLLCLELQSICCLYAKKSATS